MTTVDFDHWVPCVENAFFVSLQLWHTLRTTSHEDSDVARFVLFPDQSVLALVIKLPSPMQGSSDRRGVALSAPRGFALATLWFV